LHVMASEDFTALKAEIISKSDKLSDAELTTLSSLCLVLANCKNPAKPATVPNQPNKEVRGKRQSSRNRGRSRRKPESDPKGGGSSNNTGQSTGGGSKKNKDESVFQRHAKVSRFSVKARLLKDLAVSDYTPMLEGGVALTSLLQHAEKSVYDALPAAKREEAKNMLGPRLLTKLISWASPLPDQDTGLTEAWMQQKGLYLLLAIFLADAMEYCRKTHLKFRVAIGETLTTAELGAMNAHKVFDDNRVLSGFVQWMEEAVKTAGTAAEFLSRFDAARAKLDGKELEEAPTLPADLGQSTIGPYSVGMRADTTTIDKLLGEQAKVILGGDANGATPMEMS